MGLKYAKFTTISYLQILKTIPFQNLLDLAWNKLNWQHWP